MYPAYLSVRVMSCAATQGMHFMLTLRYICYLMLALQGYAGWRDCIHFGCSPRVTETEGMEAFILASVQFTESWNEWTGTRINGVAISVPACGAICSF